jgi:hypothetical protein
LKIKINRSAKLHQALFFLFFVVGYGIFISNDFREERLVSEGGEG